MLLGIVKDIIFLDRDPEFFRYVLHFLRTRKLELPSRTTQPLYSCLLDEFNYFCLPLDISEPVLLRTTRITPIHSFAHKCFGVIILDDKSVISTGLQDIKVWNLFSGKLQKEIKIIPPMINASDNAIDKTKNLIVWGGRDDENRGCIWIYDLETDQMNTLYGHSDTVSCIRVQEDIICSGSKDKTVRLWSIKSRSCTHTFNGHEDIICTVDMDLEKDMVVSGSYDDSIKVWSIKEGICKKTLKGHTDSVRSVKLYQKNLYSGSFDKTIKIWDLTLWQCEKTIQAHSDWISCLCIVDNTLISSSWDKSIRIWRLDGKLHKQLDEIGPVSCIHSDSDYIVCVVDKTIKVWLVADN